MKASFLVMFIAMAMTASAAPRERRQMAAIYNRENDLYKFSKRNVQKSPFFRCLSSCLRISFKRLLIGV